MPGIFAKLNLKDQPAILVLNAPESFEPELVPLQAAVIRSLEQASEVSFALAFVTRQDELDQISAALAQQAKGDALLWFAYPKGTSKKYSCEFNRDNGWEVIKQAGFQPVRMVAIDEDWSALRFRRSAYVKK